MVAVAKLKRVTSVIQQLGRDSCCEKEVNETLQDMLWVTFGGSIAELRDDLVLSVE